MSNAAPDCRKCGACCLGQLVPLGKRDSAVPIPMRTTAGTFMLTVAGRCAALRGRARVDVSCSIYDQRPQVCRAFKAGSRECLEVRAMEGLA